MSDELRWAIGLLVGAIIQTFGVIRYVLSKIDSGDKENRLERNSQVQVLEQRIDGIKERYVRRDDFDKHVERMEASLTTLHREMRDHNSNLNQRLDALMTAVMRSHPSSQKPPKEY